ncbi:MAG: acetate/propionate family kinase, partial [Bryobacteraceae bacterium]|nr:acetate/propionate family kinase [Bryobacteraceae bacterium]
MSRCILALNSGSSSLKFTLFQDENKLAEGQAEKVGKPDGTLQMVDSDGKPLMERQVSPGSHAEVLRLVLDSEAMGKLPRPDATGHRLVHGGPRHSGPALINEELIQELRQLVPLAPLHMPSAIEVIEAVSEYSPELAQVACFDTAFHQAMPEIAKRYPLPRQLWEQGVRRYGFHGLSYEYLLGALGQETRGRVVLAHLGSGASCAAVLDGKPIDTTMGLTPSGGLMMGTRTGDLDPGVVLYLIRELHYSADDVARLVDKDSGLLGVSGRSADVRDLTEASGSDETSAQALEMFCYIARKQIAAMAAALGGLDLLVFTGGIGEHAADLRDRICQGLAFLSFRVKVM